MTIIVEEGKIIAGGNADASLDDVDTYHEDRVNALWTDADDTVKEAAMLRATAGIESKYRERWIGVKTNNSITVIPQLLAWPRRKLKSETPINPDTLEHGFRQLAMLERADNQLGNQNRPIRRLIHHDGLRRGSVIGRLGNFDQWLRDQSADRAVDHIPEITLLGRTSEPLQLSCGVVIQWEIDLLRFGLQLFD